MISMTVTGESLNEIMVQLEGAFSRNGGAVVAEAAAPKAKGGRPPKQPVEQEPLQSAPAVAEASKPDLFAAAPAPAPALVATLEEASAALKAILSTAGMGMPKASAIMEKVTGKKLFREVTPDQYGALVAACKEAMK